MTESVAFVHLVLLGALIDAALAVGTLAVARLVTRRPTGLVTLITAMSIAGAGAVVQLAIVSDGFGRLHVLYLYVFVTVPVVGAVVLIARFVPWVGAGRWATVAGVGCALLSLVGVYATHIEPRWLRTDRASLDVAMVDGDPIRVGILADLQTTRVTNHERRAIDRLMAEEPDLILLAGDYLQSDAAQFDVQVPALRELLGRLSAPGGVFLVQGDVDSPERMEILTEGLDVEWLDHEVATTEVRGRRIRIGGIPVSFASAESQATIGELADSREQDIRILLTHRPDAVDEVPEGGADLVVAGHTHGGQVALPFLGPPITLSNVPRDVAAGGLHEIDGIPIYLSVGVGLERHTAPQVRFGVRPSVGILTLT